MKRTCVTEKAILDHFYSTHKIFECNKFDPSNESYYFESTDLNTRFTSFCDDRTYNYFIRDVSDLYLGKTPQNIIKNNILQEAEKIIYGDREKTYGYPSLNLENISDLWSSYINNKIRIRQARGENVDSFTPEDVCNMMILLKIARLQNQPDHRDSIVDIAGYAALIERLHEKPEAPSHENNGDNDIPF